MSGTAPTRIAIVANDSSAEARNAVTLALNASTVLWWHYLQHLWLVVDQGGRGANWWRDWVRDVSPGIAVFVLEVKDGTWSGLLPAERVAWVHQNWTRHDGTVPQPAGDMEPLGLGGGRRGE